MKAKGWLGAPSPETQKSYAKICDCMDGSVERGVIYGTGAYDKDAIRALPAMREAYEAGKNA